MKHLGFWIRMAMCACCVTAAMPLAAQECTDVLLLDAVERVRTMNLDSTGHWWAVTQPFEDLMGLIVDGKAYGPYESVLNPRFSFDGSNFAASVKVQGRWVVRTIEDSIPLEGDVLYDTYLPSMSSTPWWIHGNGADMRISTFQQSYRCASAPQGLCSDPTGTIVAWVESRGTQFALLVNGREAAIADDVLLGGILADGSVVHARKFGLRWWVYAGTQEIAPSLAAVSQLMVNTNGTACAWAALDAAGFQRVYCYSAEMNNPWMSVPLEHAAGVVISPVEALVAAKVILNGNPMVLYNGAMYPAGKQTGPLAFSNDGGTLCYGGVDGDPFVCINGKRHWVKGSVNLTVPLLLDNSNTAVAWPSATTLAYVNVETNILRLGKMCDVMGPAVYNKQSKSFMALGLVTGRLFLLTCKPL